MAPIATHTQHIAPNSDEFSSHQTTAGLSKNPLERTWRGNKENNLRIDAYPEFMNATDDEGLLKKRVWVKVATGLSSGSGGFPLTRFVGTSRRGFSVLG